MKKDIDVKIIIAGVTMVVSIVKLIIQHRGLVKKMYKVIQNRKTLKEIQSISILLKDSLNNRNVQDRLLADIECLNTHYGDNRDLKADLGGYIIILWGARNEIQNEYNSILRYHKLNADEYEYMDKIILPECDDITVTFWLFLCSSDYAVEIVTVEA